MFKIPFNWMPGSFGLKGRTRDIAQAEYELTGYELERRLLDIKKDDLEPDIAPHGMDEMVAADGKSIAVAGDDPNRQFRPRHLQAGGNGRGAPVDGVHAIGFHVVRKPAGTADA